MLKSLSIKNFAIIESVNLNFDDCFNVLIGETGAGKSIILDALKFVLGDKPSKDNIRHGQAEIQVKATFINNSSSIQDKLDEFQIEYDDVLVITRTFNIDGKSSCQINGELVTVSMLKQLGSLLFDMYGQHDNVSLLNSKNHCAMLDNFDQAKLTPIKAKISEKLTALKNINEEINKLGGIGQDRERVIDLLQYQIREIKEANLKQNEDDILQAQITAMSNYEKLYDAIEQCYLCFENSKLDESLGHLDNAAKYDSRLNELNHRLSSALIEFEDIKSSVKDFISNLSFSESELDELTERFELIKRLKKKYGPTLNDVETFLQKSIDDLDNILNSEEKLDKLHVEKNIIIDALYELCLQLHNERKKIATTVEKLIEKELSTLGMKAIFKISFAELKSKEEVKFTNNGFDEIEFLFSANVGEEEKSLSKTVSGGEMSRVMLALKNILAMKDDVSLLIFDEIDTGVSGEIGYKVGQKLATLSKSYQIICITHLPQVTALADKFIFIKKQVVNNETKSCATYLNDDELEKYIATLSGNMSQVGILHAKELLEKARSFKKTLNK